MKLNALAAKLKACLVRHPKVLAVYAYGSMAKGKARRCREMDLSSDLDLGILLDFSVPVEKRWDWWEKLYGQLGSLIPQELDLVIMNGASLGLVHEILRTGKRVYEKPGRKYRREEAQLLIEALDFLPTKIWIEEKVIEHVKANHG